MEPVESTQKPSRRLLWVGIAVVVVIIVTIIGISYMMVANTKKEAAKTSTSPSPSSTVVATKEQVAKSLTILDESAKQAAKDQASAKAAVESSKTQTKVAN